MQISNNLNFDFSIRIGTKREAELDDVSPSKLKALKASNGTNGEAPTVVDDDSSNHKNGDYHDEEDEDDDVSCRKTEEKIIYFLIFRFQVAGGDAEGADYDEEDGSDYDDEDDDDGENGEEDEGN